MASEVQIANLALQKLGAARIVSLTDDNRNARSCNACYQPMRDAELRAHPWSFAVKRAQLSPDATPPPFDFTYQFSLPSDCLRVLLPDDVDLDWKIEGRKILSGNPLNTVNGGAVLNLVYIWQITDANQFDTTFIDMVACRMAVQMCEEITQSTGKINTINEMYKVSMREARRMNAFEKLSEDGPDGSWITVRA